jgi:sialate O-acetylesterase
MNKLRIGIGISTILFRVISAAGINLIFVVCLFTQSFQLQLAPLFQDNMVLQQQHSVPIWGKGTPGESIVIRSSWGKSVVTSVDANGLWKAVISTPKAGGPFQISVRQGKSLIVVRNILSGEVWLCSGQSNMEMPMDGWPPSDTIMNSVNETEESLYPSIRMFSVKRSVEAGPNDCCTGRWIECSPLDVGSFSAAAYYFGKTLQSHLNVPIGLINSSYGGTNIESWMSNEALQPFQEYTESIKRLETCRDSLRLIDSWICQHPTINLTGRNPEKKWEGLNFGDEKCAVTDFDDKSWTEMKLPVFWEQTPLGEFDGVVWFRKQVEIPVEWRGKDLILQLGPIDDMDETFVNGQSVGKLLSGGYWHVNRVYKVAGSLTRDSLLVIAVRVIDTQSGGGIYGRGKKLVLYKDSITTGISLEGYWKYMPVAEYRSDIFYCYESTGNEFSKRPKLSMNLSKDTPTSLYNGMIHPLIPFAIKGAIWYQGENNVGNPKIYGNLLSSLIDNWRKDFQCGDFPFCFVQIAPYNYGVNAKSQLLREAQFQTLAVKNTGMVVTLDIGNPKNIHPANKEELGKRLASWAMAKAYKKNIPYSGPLYKSMKAIQGKIVLSFDYADRSLVLKPRNGELNFMIAGEDKLFKKATVKVQGKTLVVSNPEISKPVSVRYAWSNTEEGTLFNKDGLPASSFRTDDWKE